MGLTGLESDRSIGPPPEKPLTPQVPIIDVAPLVADSGDQRAVADAIRCACTENGFFYVTGHGVSEELNRRLKKLSRAFFTQDLEAKLDIRMSLAGRAWRGYFPVGGELTSGKSDVKEGLYFGSELSEEDPRVRAGLPGVPPDGEPLPMLQVDASAVQEVGAF